MSSPNILFFIGKLRDAGRLIKENWPIWCSGFSPVGCFNNELDSDLDDSIKKANFDRYNGSIAVCDDTGVVIFESQYHNQDFLDKLKLIE